MQTITKETIRRKNDAFRRTFVGGKVLLTQGVQYSPHLEELLRTVKEFDNFTQDNDPYQEHDFGKLVVQGTSYFWKIDYYDDQYQYFKEDGNRVMTIMRTDEY